MSQKLDHLVVYGDSYSDIHPATKRTNGPVWSQVLASQWNTELISLAQPGATFCQNNKKNGSWLKKQVEKDTTLSLSESSNVHVIFLGSTDLVETKGNVAKDTKKWLQCVKDQVLHLYANDPNSRIIIMGVPAFEFSPYAQTHKQSATQLKQNIIDFNVALEEEVLEWSTDSKQIKFFDTYLVFSDLLGDPSVANIENVEEAYWDKCQGKCTEDMDSYLWWDSVHVTGAGHKAIANTIQSKGFFNLEGTTSSLDSSADEVTGLPQNYIRGLSWVMLVAIFIMIVYMFRHNRLVVSLKKSLQTKAAKIYPSNRNQNHEYTLV